MATEQEIEEAEKRVDDNAVLESALTDLAAIVAGSGGYDLIIERDGVQFNFSTLQSTLKSRNANETTMISNIEALLDSLLGPDEVTLNTIRKEVRDLVTAHDADIAAT